MENKNTTSILKMDDVVNGVVDFFRFMLTKKVIAFLLILCFTILTSIYYFLQKPKYEASTSFILEEKTSSMGGGLSGLASQFGVDIGSLTGSAGLFAGDNIIDIIRSRTIIEKVLLSKIDSLKGDLSPTLADLYLDWNNLHQKWASNPALENVSFAKCTSGTPNTRLQDSVIYIIYDNLIKHNISIERVNKKNSIFEVKVNSRNEVFSKIFSERLVLETINMYVNIKTSVATRNIKRLEQRSDSLLKLLNAKSLKSAELQVLDANIAFKTSAVPVEVSQREKTVTYSLFTEVIKNLEASRMALSSQTPVINLLDNSKYPLQDKKLNLSFLVLIGILMGMGVFFAFVFVTYPSKSLN